MKRLIARFVLPLSIVTMALVTKWWYVLPEDAPGSMMTGFPMPYVCSGWATSMSEQWFIFELLVDLLTYFSVCLLIVFLLYRFASFRPGKIIMILTWSVAGIILVSILVWLQVIEVYVKPQRDFKINVLESGVRSAFTHKDRPVLPH